MSETFAGRLEYGTPEGAERRRAPRIEKTFDLSYEIAALPDEKTLLETLDKLLVARSNDISEVGMNLWTNKLLMPGTTLIMKFPQPPGQTAFECKARVVWCQPHTEGGFVRARAGLEFVDVTPAIQEQLVKLIKGG